MTRIPVFAFAFACITLFTSPLFAESGHAFRPANTEATDGIRDDGYYVYNDNSSVARDAVAGISADVPPSSITLYMSQTNPNVPTFCWYTLTDMGTGQSASSFVSVSAIGLAQPVITKPQQAWTSFPLRLAATVYCSLPPKHNGTTTKIFGFR